MFAHVLQSEGIRAQVFPQGIGSAELVSQLEADKPDAICISAVPPQTVVRTRQLCQRLSARLPQVKIVTGVWTLSDVSQVQNRLGACQSEHVVGTFADAIAMLRRYLNPVAC